MLGKLSLFLILFYEINSQTTTPPTSPHTTRSTTPYIPTTTANIVYNNCTLSGYSQYVTLDNKTCYYFSNYRERETWHDANEACQRSGAELLSIHDRLTNQLFANLSRKIFPNFYSVQYWIGLNALSQRSNFKWSDGSVYNYANYPNSAAPAGIPALPAYDYYTQGRCNYYYLISMYNSQNQYYDSYGYWYFDDCNNVHQYICAKSLGATSSPPTTTPTLKGNCPQGWYQFDNKKCVKLINTSLSYSGAQKRCIDYDYNAEVLNIHSAKEQYYITSLIAGIKSPFIGLNRPVSTSRWTWSDQSNLSYANWGQITNFNYQYKCALISTTDTKAGNWIPADCDSPHPYICERNKDASITTVPPKTFANCTIFAGMSNFVQYRNSCYYVNDVLDTWDNAVGYCQRMSESHLVSIQNGFEYSFLMYYTLEYSKNSNHWIGFFSTNVNGLNTPQAFEWIDTSPNYYSHWDDNEPAVNTVGNKVCVYQTNTNGTWKTSDCNQKRAYICKKTLDKVPEVNYTLGICPNNSSPDPTQKWVDVDKRSKYCYWFSMVLKNMGAVTWPDASFHCKQRNGSLASIHSDHDLSILKSSISSAQYNTWIGLYQQPGGAYGWDDGSAVDFTNWDITDDDDLLDVFDDICVEVQASDLRWHKAKCTQYSGYKYYVCQIPKLLNTSISATTSPTTASKSSDMSNGEKAGIIISVLLVVSIIGVGFFYAIRKYNINMSSLPSLDNRAHSSTANNSPVSDEPKVSFSKIENSTVFHRN